ncbi:class I SAM-dependent methyltransferase [Streptomyces sp. Y7]|uniref:class I SAM-dependent methyltransferase n=1 Tax=Streptomyces sp. Y7 TaxID=3342392 RepID=UPI003720B246
MEKYGETLVALDQDEEARLRLLAEVFDPLCTRTLDALDVDRAARCLEVGAGSGSVAQWLCGQARDGEVIAADLDLRLLERVPEPRLRRLVHDVTTDPFPDGSFDVSAGAALSAGLSAPLAGGLTVSPGRSSTTATARSAPIRSLSICGGTRLADFWRLTVDMSREQLIAGGHVTPYELDEFYALLHDDAFWDLAPALVQSTCSMYDRARPA